LEGTSLATATDDVGNFFFSRITPGNYTLAASGVGYNAAKQNVVVTENKTTVLHLVLDESESVLREVVVTSRIPFETITTATTRTPTLLKDLPQSVQLINRKTLDQQQVYRIDEALKNTAGVNLSSSYGAFNFRGFVTNGTEFLTNGMKGSVYPEGVMPGLTNVERVDVLRGPSAILYGEGAVGGTINFVTKQPKKFTTANVRLSAGSFDLLRGQGDITGSLNKQKTLYYVASAGYERGGKFTRNFDNQNLLLYSSIKWEISSKTHWQVFGTYNRDRMTSNFTPDVPFYPNRLFSIPKDFSGFSSDARYKGDSYQLQSQLQHRFSAHWNANLLLGYSRSRADRIDYSLGGYVDTTTHLVNRSKTITELERPVRTVNAYVNGSFLIGRVKNALSTGIDLTFDNDIYTAPLQTYEATPLHVLAPDYTAFIPGPETIVYYYSSREKFTTRTYGTYVQDQISFSEKVKAVAGLRFNHYYFHYRADSLSYDLVNFETFEEKPENTTELLPRIGLIYQPVSTVSLYIDYNRGFVPQYANTKQAGGPFPAERSHQFEFGFKGDFFNHRLMPTLALYRIYKENVLTADLADSTGRKRRAVGQVQSQGFEFTLTGSVAKGWDVIANYSYNDTEITQSNIEEEVGQRFNNSPRHMASFWTTYQWSRTMLKGLTIGGGYRYTSDRYIGDKQKAESNAMILPAYHLVDVLLGYQYRQFHLQVNVNNLFNRQYAQGSFWPQSYFPGTPRNFLLTLGYKFN
jgi:iron complex outermembrane receptor protein